MIPDREDETSKKSQSLVQESEVYSPLPALLLVRAHANAVVQVSSSIISGTRFAFA
jgi:hypothetical protein